MPPKGAGCASYWHSKAIRFGIVGTAISIWRHLGEGYRIFLRGDGWAESYPDVESIAAFRRNHIRTGQANSTKRAGFDQDPSGSREEDKLKRAAAAVTFDESVTSESSTKNHQFVTVPIYRTEYPYRS